MAEFRHHRRDVWSTKPKIWSVWSFLEENCQALNKIIRYVWLMKERWSIRTFEEKQGQETAVPYGFMLIIMCQAPYGFSLTKSLGQSFWRKYCGHLHMKKQNGDRAEELAQGNTAGWWQRKNLKSSTLFPLLRSPTSPRSPSSVGLECESSMAPYLSYHLRYRRNCRGFCSCHHSNSEPAWCWGILIFGKVLTIIYLPQIKAPQHLSTQSWGALQNQL